MHSVVALRKSGEMSAQDQPLATVDAGAGASSASGYEQTENGNEDFIIQPQGQGDNSDASSDEGYYSYADSDASSFLSSILSEVRRGVEVAGRIYPAHGRHEYGMPMDEKEMDRNDLQHHKFTLLLNDKLYAAPIPDEQLNQHNSRVLDIGCGTGIWSIDMADKFPNADVTGVDLAPTQPSFTPPNCFFEIDDIEEDWAYQRNHFDFVHGRDLLTAVRDWPRLIGQAYDHLKPGGWIQLASTIPDIQSDDNTLPDKSYYVEAGRLYFEMAERMGAPLDSPRKWADQMQAAGFEEVRDVVYKIPMGTWPRARRLRVIGRLEQMMLVEGFEAFMLRGYVQILGGRAEDLAFILAHARREITDPNIHTYVDFHVTYGRKPQRTFGTPAQ